LIKDARSGVGVRQRVNIGTPRRISNDLLINAIKPKNMGTPSGNFYLKFLPPKGFCQKFELYPRIFNPCAFMEHPLLKLYGHAKTETM
jgi:hypothetical protein